MGKASRERMTGRPLEERAEHPRHKSPSNPKQSMRPPRKS